MRRIKPVRNRCDGRPAGGGIGGAITLLFRAAVALFAAIGLVAVVIVIANAREPYGGPLEA